MTDGDATTATKVVDSSHVWMRWMTSSLVIDFFFSSPIALCQINMQLYGKHLDSRFIIVEYDDDSRWGTTTLTLLPDSGSDDSVVTVTLSQKSSFLSFGNRVAPDRTTKRVRLRFIWSPFANETIQRSNALLAISEVTLFKCGK